MIEGIENSNLLFNSESGQSKIPSGKKKQEMEMEIDISGQKIIDCGGLFLSKKKSRSQGNSVKFSSPDDDTSADLVPKSKSESSVKEFNLKKTKLFPGSSQDDGGLRGLNGLESVVARLERRFAVGDEFYSESSDSDNDIVTKANSDNDNDNGNTGGKKRKRKKKLTKEEREWLDEGRGFLDDEFDEEVDRKVSDKDSKLQFDGFYVFRGPLRKQTVQPKKDEPPAKKSSKKNNKTASGKSSSEESEGSGNDSDESDFISTLSSKSTSAIKRVRELLDSLDNATETLNEQFPPALDLALTNLEKVVKKSVSKYTQHEGYRAMLLDLLPAEPEIIELNMRRIRLLSNVRFHKSSYIKSVGTLRKWAKERMAALQTKPWTTIDPDVWNLTFNSLLKSDGTLKPPEVVHRKLEKLYKSGFKGTPVEKSEATWTQVKAKVAEVGDLVAAIDKGKDYAAETREICRMCIGLVTRMEKKKVKFLWNEEGRKLVKDVGIYHRKWSYSAAKVRDVETQLYSEPKTEGKTRRSMIKQVCIIWPEKSMQFEEIMAMTADSIINLPKEFKLTMKSPKKSKAKGEGKSKSPVKKKQKEGKSPTKEKKADEARICTPKKKKSGTKKENATKKGAIKSSSKKKTPEKGKGKKKKNRTESKEAKKSKLTKEGNKPLPDDEEEKKAKAKLKTKAKQKKSPNDNDNNDDTDDVVVREIMPSRGIEFDSPPKYRKSDFPYPLLPKKKG